VSRARIGALLALAVLTLQLPAPTAAKAGLRPIALGFSDDLFLSPTPQVRDTWLNRAVALGSQVVRLDAGWPASRRPQDPTNPSDPAYNFSSLDAGVRDATARGLSPLLSFTGAPAWAEGPGRPASASPASWLPQAAAVGAYGEALAKRYDGSFPDPLYPGAFLPRVRSFQLWNEPNLSMYLSPQWQRVKGKWVAVAPVHYRAMLNAFYAGVKAGEPSATVVTAGTAPFGDFGHGQRMMPLLFWRYVLAAPVSFDVIAHQPYSFGAPAAPALNADDISIADIGKLTKLVRGAERRGTALPQIHHMIWVTETGYNTKPPNPGGVPVATDARWVEQTLYLLWSQGVSLVTWYLIRDRPPAPTYGDSSETGMYYLSGDAKLAALAFRFPVVGVREPRRTFVWLRAPSSGMVQVEARERGAWRVVARRSVRAFEVIEVGVPHNDRDFRATVRGLTSLIWR
jgi:hypothetical protein